MHSNDPIGDMLTRMRNAQHARKGFTEFPWSRIKEDICGVLKREGYVHNIELSGEGHKRMIKVSFVPEKKITVKRESSPGRRLYLAADQVKPVLHGYGLAILSTSSGLLTDKEAREKHVGGEILCTVS